MERQLSTGGYSTLMRKVLVTGCSGFIGMHLCERLIKLGENVLGIDNMNDYYDTSLKDARLKRLLKNDNFSFLKIDLCQTEPLKSAFNEYAPSIAVNLAAQPGVRYSLTHPEIYIESNIMGFMNVLECCRLFDIKKLVYASSSSVYGDSANIPFSESDKVDKPVSIYAASKKANELMAYAYSNLYGLSTIGLRFFTVYGPWGRPDMSYFIFCEKINNGEPISVFNNGENQRDFTYIDDIVDGTISAIYSDSACEIFNLGNNSYENVMDMIHLIEDYLGKKAIIVFADKQPGDVKKTFADINYSAHKLNYNPKTQISEGIPKFIEWYKSYKI